VGSTIVETLADFTTDTQFADLPEIVVEESKRVLLDSVGCALGGVEHPKGRIGIDFGRILGGAGGDATIIGTADRVSVFGASFANGELINALDFDAVLPPGHVSPYVVPGALAVGESLRSSGKELIAALALSHEISYRFGKSMDWTRDTEGGEVSVSPVLGYTSTVFGASAAIARMKGLSSDVVANALGIAAHITQVNSHRAWMNRATSSTIKYTMGGVIAQTALTAVYMAELGHRGAAQVLDDADYGYRRFIGTKRWVPENLTDRLGTEWRYPAENSYKPYPHCRVMHGLFDALRDLMEQHDLRPEEIEAMRAWGEGWVMLPVWLNTMIEHVHDGQFSVLHGLAVAAQRIPPGPAWQDPALVFDPAVLGLMDRITFSPHPDYVTSVTRNPASRPSRVEIDARGTTFTAEREYYRGSPSPDPTSFMTTNELVDKFLVNAAVVLPRAQAEEAAAAILELENADDVSLVVRLFGTGVAAPPAGREPWRDRQPATDGKRKP
jgi:2-methylcitrate dehydratase PrpD